MTAPAQSDLVTAILTTRKDLDAIRSEWSDLASGISPASLYFTPEWMLTWWDCFATGRMQPAVVTVRRQNRLIGIAPFMIKRESFLGFPTSSVEFISMARFADDPLCLPGTLDFIVGNDHESVVRAIWDAVVAMNGWDMIRLHPVPAASRSVALLESLASTGGYQTVRRNVDANYHIRPAGSIEEYLAGLNPSFHERVAAKHRQLASDPRARFRVVRMLEELPAGFKTIERIEEQSWKARNGIPIRGPEYRDFFPAFARIAARQGWLRIALLEYDGEPIAYEYAAAYRGTLESFKGSYDDRKRKMSPGRMLDYDFYLRSLREGLSDINLFSGEQEDKLKWKPDLEPFSEIFVYNRSSYARFLHRMMFGARFYVRRRHVAYRIEEQRKERHASLPVPVGTVLSFAGIASGALHRRFTRNAIINNYRRKHLERKTICHLETRHSGVIEVVDIGRQRQLLIAGEVASIFFVKGSWNEARREYWGVMTRSPYELPKNPRLLLIGLGGGTILHLLDQDFTPASTTVIELDPAVISCAKEHFGIGELKNVSIIEGNALKVIEKLHRDGERFDYILDDVFFEPEALQLKARIDLWRRYTSLLLPGGSIALNTIAESKKKIGLMDGFIEVIRKEGYQIRMTDLQYISPNRVFFLRPPQAGTPH
jgi:CelD/BcsL family acetyltransferase involved in cellulose biosynthesis/2-polyprenyl-3-methyl-5-hydroxy-6-metoxy-1,4-benzoquinol methylase